MCEARHMKVFFASRYVDPINPRANRNIVNQARVLQDKFGIDLEILTWPTSDLWSGPLPDQVPTLDPLKVRREGLNYSVILGPASWDEVAGGNVISERAWESAVGYGMSLLATEKPDIFHLHHRFGFWWLLESAQRLCIPTVYSNYDWGMACLRTILVNGAGDLCDGVVEPEKCAACIKTGRTRLAGRLNELLAETWVGQRILTLLDHSAVTSEKFRALGAVSKPALQRTMIHQQRVKRVIQGLGHCVTPSEFGKRFFQQFGIAEQKLTVLPWPHKTVMVEPPRSSSTEPFTITFIGRVSPDKGVHLIFEALERLSDIPAVLLRVAGADESQYSAQLQGKYPEFVGIHRVEWQGWSPIDALLRTTDVTIIPSMWMDNTPLTLIEAMAHGVPVIATNISTVSELLKNGVGYLAEFNSIGSLSCAIKNAVSDIELIRSRKSIFPKIPTPHEYGAELYEIYANLIRKKSAKVTYEL
jgi:glycosyltransferase involved in cell wall biosynthesis